MTMNLPNILIVDDKDANLLTMEMVLKDAPCHIVRASSGNEALTYVLQNDFALILLDVQMPDMDGFETAEIIRSNPKTRPIPIIFVSAISKESKHVFHGYDSGAVDYLCKPFDAKILQGKVNIFLELYTYKQELQQANVELAKRKQELESLAITDDLSKLYNRRHCNHVLKKEFAKSKRYGTDLSCLLLDLDHFKVVNDTYDHAFGDEAIKTFGQRTLKIVRGVDYVFRFGGEEFLVLLPHTNIEGAQMTAEKIGEAMNKAIKYKEKEAIVTVSTGISSTCYHKPKNKKDLIAMADKALYLAKDNGRNRWEIIKN